MKPENFKTKIWATPISPSQLLVENPVLKKLAKP
jgi:hypothetical protein